MMMLVIVFKITSWNFWRIEHIRIEPIRTGDLCDRSFKCGTRRNCGQLTKIWWSQYSYNAQVEHPHLTDTICDLIKPKVQYISLPLTTWYQNHAIKFLIDDVLWSRFNKLAFWCSRIEWLISGHFVPQVNVFEDFHLEN